MLLPTATYIFCPGASLPPELQLPVWHIQTDLMQQLRLWILWVWFDVPDAVWEKSNVEKWTEFSDNPMASLQKLLLDWVNIYYRSKKAIVVQSYCTTFRKSYHTSEKSCWLCQRIWLGARGFSAQWWDVWDGAMWYEMEMKRSACSLKKTQLLYVFKIYTYFKTG